MNVFPLFPLFAQAIKRYPVSVAHQMLGIKSRSQVCAYRAGRKLPKAERLLLYPDLVAACAAVGAPPDKRRRRFRISVCISVCTSEGAFLVCKKNEKPPFST